MAPLEKKLDNAHLQHHVITQQLIGAFYDVYHELRAGFLETGYQRAMTVRLRELAIPAETAVASVPPHGLREDA